MSGRTMLLVGLLMAAGCSGSDLPRGVPIRGTVSYNGAPVTQGSVYYFPVQTGQGREAMGAILEDGTFDMHTSRSIPGVLPGEYRIAVVARPEISFAPPDRSRRASPSDQSGRAGPPNRGAPPQHPRLAVEQKPPIPEKYASPETSGLTDTVNDQHSGTKEIVLE